MSSSGANTKASKIERLLSRQVVINEGIEKAWHVISNQCEALAAQRNTIGLLTETANRLEAENDRLRKYLGSELFKRRQRDMQIPTLEATDALFRAHELRIDREARQTQNVDEGAPLTVSGGTPPYSFRGWQPTPPICNCAPGVCKGSVINVYRCRHCINPSLEPKFGNRDERNPGACSCEPGACRGYSICRFAK